MIRGWGQLLRMIRGGGALIERDEGVGGTYRGWSCGGQLYRVNRGEVCHL